MKYDWILFDIDETLLRFNAYDALGHVFKMHAVTFTEEDFLTYEIKNKALWEAYQRGEITLTELQYDRFSVLSKKLKTPPLDLNTQFLDAIAHVSTPLDGAIELLTHLNGKTKLGVITNGITDIQKRRLISNDMQHHFDFVITSQEVGVPKPQIAIFEHAFERMNHPPREKILMIGDTLESDILGGINAGIHTCWLNPHGKTAPADITPHFEIPTLEILKDTCL